jgi:hypothetical protein
VSDPIIDRVTEIKRARWRRRRGRRSLELAADARRRIAAASSSEPIRRRGRLWLNGRELGDPDGRFAHLASSYD